MIKIIGKANYGHPVLSKDIKFLSDDGKKIKNIYKCEISIDPGDIARATLTIGVEDLNLECDETMIYTDGKGNRFKKLTPKEK
ncbi:MAG: hypothetical protein DWP95_10405 [Proteobacteria bacterium]|nr:MAG: hypothetical protein DWP95_10405 [Pseudomonadota bacterium]